MNSTLLNIKIQKIVSLADWQGKMTEWDRLAKHNFMLQSPWLLAWWDAFGSSRELYVLEANDGNGVLGFLPLVRSFSRLYGWQLEFLGGDRACSDNISLLADPEHIEQVSDAFAAHLAHSRDWDRLNLDGVQPNNPRNVALLAAFEKNGIVPVYKDAPSCWRTSLEGGWDSFLKRLSKRARRLLRKQEENYLDNARCTVQQPQSLEEAVRMTERIAELHQARSRAVDRDGAFACEPFQRFLLNVVEGHWKNGSLFLSMLNFEGNEIAGSIGVWSDDALNVYLCGMDPVHSDHRPGWTLNIGNVKFAIERGVDIDFLRGDEFYKERLGAVPTVQGRWVAAAPRLIPRLRHSAYQAATWLRDNYLERKKAEPNKPAEEESN